nr:MAG TPA: tail sheath protein [Caudoviricetes sp.]
MGCTNKTRSNAPRVRIGTDTIFSVALYRHDGEIGTSPDPDVADVIDPHTLTKIDAEVLSDSGLVEAVDVRIDGHLLTIEISQELTTRMSLGLYRLRLKVREEDARFSDGYRDVTLLADLCQVVPDGSDTGKPKANISAVISQLASGESAYQIYLRTTSDNPKKSETEWVASLTGATGKSAYQIYLETTSDNPKKSETEWVASLTGATGKSAYQIYLETTSDNPKKSETEWVASLTGKSAYQIYLDTTNDSPKMTEEQWATGGWLVVLEQIKNIRGTR